MRKLQLLLLSGLLLAVQLTWAQKKPATGKVTDPAGAPLYGISIIEKGTKNGTTTATDGTFSMSVNANSKLVISGVGVVNAAEIAKIAVFRSNSGIVETRRDRMRQLNLAIDVIGGVAGLPQ